MWTACALAHPCESIAHFKLSFWRVPSPKNVCQHQAKPYPPTPCIPTHRDPTRPTAQGPRAEPQPTPKPFWNQVGT